MTAKIRKATRPKRPVKIQVHFNKKNSKKELPWTVHIRGACIPAREVLWDSDVISRTVWKPEKATNPRGWIECYGIVEIDGYDRVRIKYDR